MYVKTVDLLRVRVLIIFLHTAVTLIEGPTHVEAIVGGTGAVDLNCAINNGVADCTNLIGGVITTTLPPMTVTLLPVQVSMIRL